MKNDSDQRTIPLFEEELRVTKSQILSDQVRVSTTVEEQAVLIEDQVARSEVFIDRIAVNIPVDEAPQLREEGDTVVVSVVEERIVVEKRLFVIEEIRLTRASTIEHIAIPETIRTMRATVERIEPSPQQGEKDG